MKLYTEEEVRRLYQIAYLGGYGKYIMDFEEDIKQIKPIELNHEKIEKMAQLLYPINKGGSMWMPSRDDINKGNKQEGFIEGANWMKQILKQNNITNE